MDEETAIVDEPQEVIEQVLEVQEQEVEQDIEQVEVASEPKHVPLSALQKERKKRQELEEELKWERRAKELQMQQMAKPEPEDDSSRYESATREDLVKAQNESIRIIEEKLWIKQNPEKYQKVNENLEQFLKQRPNLTQAIAAASNRYEEAFALMEALTPKQQTQLKQSAAPKKVAPNAPTSVPKSAALNETVDVMSMSDAEFNKWRQSQKRRR